MAFFNGKEKGFPYATSSSECYSRLYEYRYRKVITLKKALAITMISLSLTACSINTQTTEQKDETVPASAEQKQQTSEQKQSQETKQEQSEDIALEDGTVQVGEPESITAVVNKERKLPGDYVPNDLTVPDVPFYFEEFQEKKQLREPAARALEDLIAAAEADGMNIVAASGYRSYDRQTEIYDRNVEIYGKEETDTFSAEPGTSEHQTGLAMDVTSAQMAFKLDQSFGETPEGKWLAEHAHEYGFIIRYTEGKEDITGYTYEPWHLRYVGTEYSTEVHEESKSLEEFFGFYKE